MVGAVAAHLVQEAETWKDLLVAGAARATKGAARGPDLWLAAEGVGVAAAGLGAMVLTGVYGPALWLTLAGALVVAGRTRSQLYPSSPLELVPALRSLAVVFALTAALAAFGLAPQAALAASGQLLVGAGAVIVAVLLLHRARRRPPRVVVVGDSSAISRAAMQWADGSAQVVGGVIAGAPDHRLRTIVGVPSIVGLDDVADWADGRMADLVVLAATPEITPTQARALAWSLERTGIPLAVTGVVGDAAPHRLRGRRLGLTTVVELSPSRRGAVVRGVKSALDRVLGVVLLVLAAPFLLATMALIRLDSPGAPLFRQTRMGQGGRPFTLYKLRTMHVDAESRLSALRPQNEASGFLFKLHQDPRVTRVGRFLRRSSMDELPQLLNVVRGEMSLIGPRPALPHEVAAYDDVELRRLAVKPGMTGLWQVSGRSDLDWETGIALDLHYVDNWRVSDDLLIGLRTVGAVVGAHGAY